MALREMHLNCYYKYANKDKAVVLHVAKTYATSKVVKTRGPFY